MPGGVGMIGNPWLRWISVFGIIFCSNSCQPVKHDGDLLKSSLSDAFGVIGILKDDEIDSQIPVGKNLPFSASSRTNLGLTLEAFRGVQLA